MAHRTSPEDSSSSEGIPTPSTSSIGDYNPSIVHSNGWVESDHGLRAEEHASQMNPPSGTNEHTKDYPIASSPQDAIVIDARPDHRKNDADMLRLEALVAVATSGKE
ncbi:MAG: hypothetical protein M1825_005411 [Sarcosagium campestre]|nr:MAG: hypothetical protein M1825_005411 [Sarcosagium campestre]